MGLPFCVTWCFSLADFKILVLYFWPVFSGHVCWDSVSILHMGIHGFPKIREYFFPFWYTSERHLMVSQRSWMFLFWMWYFKDLSSSSTSLSVFVPLNLNFCWDFNWIYFCWISHLFPALSSSFIIEFFKNSFNFFYQAFHSFQCLQSVTRELLFFSSYFYHFCGMAFLATAFFWMCVLGYWFVMQYWAYFSWVPLGVVFLELVWLCLVSLGTLFIGVRSTVCGSHKCVDTLAVQGGSVWVYPATMGVVSSIWCWGFPRHCWYWLLLESVSGIGRSSSGEMPDIYSN